MDYPEKSELKKAIWQYMIDHTRMQPNGYYGVQLYFKDQADFWRRVMDRMNGFKRYEEEQKELVALRKQHIIKKYHVLRDAREHRQLKIEKIKNQGSLIQRILLEIYFRISQYLFKNETQ
jgi:hypothetical protein